MVSRSSPAARPSTATAEKSCVRGDQWGKGWVKVNHPPSSEPLPKAERPLRCKGEEIWGPGGSNRPCTQGRLALLGGHFLFACSRGMFPFPFPFRECFLLWRCFGQEFPRFTMSVSKLYGGGRKGQSDIFQHWDVLFWWPARIPCRSFATVPRTEHVPSAETGGLHKRFRIKPPDTLAKRRYRPSPEELWKRERLNNFLKVT